jgi:hypothetical protein
LVRKEVRRYYRDFAVVNVEATKLGEGKIDQLNPFYVRLLSLSLLLIPTFYELTLPSRSTRRPSNTFPTNPSPNSPAPLNGSKSSPPSPPAS